MGKSWSDNAVRNLTDWTTCPRCDWKQLTDGWCPNCYADLRGPLAAELAEASRLAVSSLEARQAVLDRIPTTAPVQQPVAPIPAPVAAAAPAPAAERPSSQISVQSVLAVAGAGLVAVAAIVFTFFNPDLTDATLRTVVVAAISVVFLAAAWLLAWAKLQFSAEAVGALAMVFVILDIWAIATTQHDGVSDYAVAAVATIVLSIALIVLSLLRRLRTWLWSGLVGLALTPLLFGLAFENTWATAVGWLVTGLAAVGTHFIARRLRGRFDSTLRFDHGTATALQGLSVISVLVLMFTVPAVSFEQRIIGVSALLGGLAVLALLSTLTQLRPFWSYLAAAFASAALAVLPLVARLPREEYFVALVPAVAAGAVALIGTLALIGRSRAPHVIDRIALLAGTLTVGALSIVPAGVIGLAQVLSGGAQAVQPEIGMPALIGLAFAALALLVLGLGRRSLPFGVLSLSLALFSLVLLATWTGFSDVVRVVASLTVAVALVAIATLIPVVRRANRGLRIPQFVASHALIVLAAVLTLGDPMLTIVGGIGAVIAISILAAAMPRVVRAGYAGVAFAYGLGLFAFSLSELTVLDGYAIVGLTAALALVITVKTTLITRVPVDFWYTSLVVAAIPFTLAIGSMLLEIRGWIAISAGVALALAVILVMIHRPGHQRWLRAGAAAMLLPLLSVVVITIVAPIAEQSASPITLPIIAGLVAASLPTTVLVGRLLIARGHSAEDADAVRLVLEVSALVTGAIAVLLTLLRAAAGFETTFLVLVIVGLGAAATGQFVRRRYAWYVAFISFTGALWSLLALNSVHEFEPYVMPPAIAAAVIGAIAVARGRNGLGFYTGGLGVAVTTPLLVLAITGNEGDGGVEIRAYALLAGAAALVAVGAALGVLRERLPRLSRLRTATLFAGLGAASAGVIQGWRYGWRLDETIYGGSDAVMLPVLVFALIAAAIAAVAAALLAHSPRLGSSRWLYVPAMLLLVLGPMSAWRKGEVYSWTLLILMAVILAVMIVTVVRARTRDVTLPPVWVTFAIATATGIAGWSEHTVFRVEAYSVTLGLALLAAGVIAWRPVANPSPSVTRWPIGYSGSWALLAPGIIVVLAISIMATLTDPRTERAILVIALALVAILLGNRLRLAAPFFLGIAALPLENLIVFAVQIGDKIQPTTWWITLASAGAVLLVLAVSSERRASGEGGVGARLRDLR